MILFRTVVIVIGVVVISAFYLAVNPSFARGGMGGMGHDMMGMPQGSEEETPITVNASHAKALLSYIQDRHLPCMQCHAISKNTVGPSFASVAARYAHSKDATQKISDHIAHGFGQMPPGLANGQQAGILAKQIMSLAEGSTTSENH